MSSPKMSGRADSMLSTEMKLDSDARLDCLHAEMKRRARLDCLHAETLAMVLNSYRTALYALGTKHVRYCFLRYYVNSKTLGPSQCPRCARVTTGSSGF